MDNISQLLTDYPGLFRAFRILTVTSTIFISGLSFCLSTWVIPNIYLIPPAYQAKQFTATVEKGARYLMRASRTMMFTLVLNTILTYLHPDPAIQRQWKRWAAMVCTLVPAAPYEIFAIFPINDKIMAMNKQVEKDKQELSEQQVRELKSLLQKWAARNFGRIAMPLVASIIGMYSL